MGPSGAGKSLLLRAIVDLDERQRLAFARALCFQPEALLLDEPTASLDGHATGLVEDLIRQCCGDGMALLLVTHGRRQAERMAKLLLISDGRIDQPSEIAP
jgi:ABC-type lipoprotein export system ATPase subunit